MYRSAASKLSPCGLETCLKTPLPSWHRSRLSLTFEPINKRPSYTVVVINSFIAFLLAIRFGVIIGLLHVSCSIALSARYKKGKSFPATKLLISALKRKSNLIHTLVQNFRCWTSSRKFDFFFAVKSTLLVALGLATPISESPKSINFPNNSKATDDDRFSREKKH